MCFWRKCNPLRITPLSLLTWPVLLLVWPLSPTLPSHVWFSFSDLILWKLMKFLLIFLIIILWASCVWRSATWHNGLALLSSLMMSNVCFTWHRFFLPCLESPVRTPTLPWAEECQSMARNCWRERSQGNWSFRQIMTSSATCSTQPTFLYLW